MSDLFSLGLVACEAGSHLSHQVSDPNGAVDPTNILGDDLMCAVLAHLPTRQLLKCSLVSRAWRHVARSDVLWEQACRDRWADKVYVPAAADTHLTWKQRYLKAEAQRKRSSTSITFEELTAFTWKFRFKRAAGPWFQHLDPYWVHGKDESKMLKRRFTTNGRFEAPDGDPFKVTDEDEAMVWTFTGSRNVRVNEYPSLNVKRTPDWGFEMANMWVVLLADLKPNGPFSRGISGVKYAV